MRALLLALAIGCGPKLGPPTVSYGDIEPLPLVQTSRDTRRWYVLVDTQTHGERLFFFDSGFARTTCDDDYVEELGLDRGGIVFVRGVAGTLVSSKAALPEMQIGGHRIERFACIVRDLNTTSSIKDPLEVEVAGVLGADLLTRFVTDIDPASATVRLIPPDEIADLRLQDADVVRLRRSGPAGVRFMVSAEMGLDDGWLLLDTGASGTHVDGRRYGLEPTSTQEDAWLGGTGKGGGRQQDLHFYDGSTVVLADHEVSGLRLVDRKHGVFGFDLLGLNVLSHFHIVLDPQSGTARFAPAAVPVVPQYSDLRPTE